MSLPRTQRVAQFQRFGEPAKILTDYPVPDPATLSPNECLVKMEYAGVCHSDVHARDGDLSVKPTLPRIGGHEGVGTIVAIGNGTVNSPVNIGDRVGLKFLARTCLKCEYCSRGTEFSCTAISIHGFTVDGSFAEYAVAWTDYVTPIPDSLDSAAATPLMCAGVTVYKGLKAIDHQPGDWIAIPGAGGGLGHLAVQYARHMGFRVIAIDSGKEKQDLCLSLGAEKWIDFRESGSNLVDDVTAAADGKGPHAALVAAGSAVPFTQALFYLRPSGTLVGVGVPDGTFDVPFEVLIGKQLRIFGSALGSPQDTIEAIAYAAQGKVKCRYSVRPLEDLDNIFADLQRGNVAGRVVIKLSQPSPFRL
ncbi:mannitol-1-phosphate dehydrogenase MPDH1 [Pisolithus marmoratus]|nr:mannitol-1-phosphate dehydrogenase MPDH1 [Pisolithus marmoratus]